ncbi:MAG TPA: cupredoxin domain-containing protein [Candidatus Dormibacteraeota bacterium]|nr:cupredoxin domain-containing protein [Candidatus Dormibacteraeota bacterium]
MTLLKATIFLTAMFLALRTSPGHADSPKRIEIAASRFKYDPDRIVLKKGEAVILVLRSTDVTHGLKVPEMNIKAEIKKDNVTEIQITPEETGHFVGKCAHFCGKGHGSMTLQIDVVP